MNGSSLSEEELKMLEDIFNVLLDYHLRRIASRSAKSRAIKELGPHKQGQKSLATTYAYHFVLEAINNGDNHEDRNNGVLPVPFMHRDLRNQLPEDLQKIAPASLSRILDRIAGIAHLERKEGKPESRSRKRSMIEDLGGRRFYYHPMETRDNDEVAKLLSKPNAQEWLNCRIVESGLLLEYAKYYTLMHYYEIRLDPAKMLKTVEPHTNRLEDRLMIESSQNFKRIKELGKDQLEEEAEKKAIAYVHEHREDADLFKRLMYGISITSNQ